MVSYILLNDTELPVDHYQERSENGHIQIDIDFKVKSQHYHEIATLLYQRTFEVKVPQKQLEFTGTIREYYTSTVNLYEANQVADYHLSLVEVRNEESRMDEY